MHQQPDGSVEGNELASIWVSQSAVDGFVELSGVGVCQSDGKVVGCESGVGVDAWHSTQKKVALLQQINACLMPSLNIGSKIEGLKNLWDFSDVEGVLDVLHGLEEGEVWGLLAECLSKNLS